MSFFGTDHDGAHASAHRLPARRFRLELALIVAVHSLGVLPIATAAAQSLPAGAVIVSAVADLPDADETPLSVRRRTWGVLLDSSTRRVLVPAGSLLVDRELPRLVAAPTVDGGWVRFAARVIACDPWSDWGVLEPDPEAMRSWGSDAAPIVARPSAAELVSYRPSLADGDEVQGLPTPDAWLFETDPVGWRGVWRSERTGLRQADNPIVDAAERWNEFGGFRRIETTERWSAGPLFDRAGGWVGWATEWEGNVEAGLDPANPLGKRGSIWAVPIEAEPMRLWLDLVAGKRPEFGFLGIRPRPASDQVTARGFRGVSVCDVPRATPAWRAGLRFGDLITHLDGEPIDDGNRLLYLVASRAPGSELEIEWQRGVLTDRPMRIVRRVRLAKRPETPVPGEASAEGAFRYGFAAGRTDSTTRSDAARNVSAGGVDPVPEGPENDVPETEATETESFPRLEVDWGTASPRFSEVAERLPEATGLWIASRRGGSAGSTGELEPGRWIVAIDGQVPEMPSDLVDLLAAAGSDVTFELLTESDSATRPVRLPTEVARRWFGLDD